MMLSRYQSSASLQRGCNEDGVASMKTCTLDPLPSSILLVCIEELLPVISKMVNLSLEHDYFADDWKGQ